MQLRDLTMKENNTSTYILQFIFALIMVVVICISFVGCGSIKEVPVQTVEKIVYKDTTIHIKDTVKIEVPKEVVKEIVPQDTTSILRTSVALSEAKIEKGMLHHKLSQIGHIKAQIDTVVTVQYVDRIVQKEVPIEVEVEKRVIPNWAWISLIINIVIFLLFIFKIYLKFHLNT